MTPIEMQLIAIREQAQESLMRCLAENIKAAERIAETGQPFDDDDRLIIRKVMMTELGNLKSYDL